jgi:hypothetical protein
VSKGVRKMGPEEKEGKRPERVKIWGYDLAIIVFIG